MAPTGIFTLEVPGKRVAVGRFVAAGSEITFRFQVGSPYCPEEPGIYMLAELDGALTLAIVRDTCPERTDAFAKPFARPATTVVTSR